MFKTIRLLKNINTHTRFDIHPRYSTPQIRQQTKTNKWFRKQEMEYYKLQKESDKNGTRRIDISK